MQAIAADVDVVAVIEHLEPLPALGRIERMLTIAWRSGATPLIDLTKADLVEDAEFWCERVAEVAPGTRALAVRAETGAGMAELEEILARSGTLVLMGPSLAGAELMATGKVRGDGRGRHTTTHRELVRLPAGGWLIDTPGVRTIGVVATQEAVAATFADVDDIAQRCRSGTVPTRSNRDARRSRPVS